MKSTVRILCLLAALFLPLSAYSAQPGYPGGGRGMGGPHGVEDYGPPSRLYPHVHQMERMENHMEGMMNRMRSMEREMGQMMREMRNREMRQEMVRLQSEIRDLYNEMRRTQRRMDALGDQMRRGGPRGGGR